jgi:hypothetical protein
VSSHRSQRQRRRDPTDDVAARSADAQLRAEAAALRRASRRFDDAIEQDAAAWGMGRDIELLERLHGEAITGMGRVAYSSNAVFLVELEGRDPGHPAEPLRAIYKPARGERPLWDFPRQTLHMREVAAYVVSAALDDGFVPPTTLREGPHGPGSMQLFIHGAEDTAQVPQDTVEEQLRGLAALDVLINNADRKRVHLLFGDDGGLRGIDNALSFLPHSRQRTVLIELGGQPLPERVAARVRSLASDPPRRIHVRETLSRLLEGVEVTAFEERLEALASTPLYPRLDPWEGRPFEWW